jgi:FAD/FMN-containing dehydrogenase
VLLEKLKSIVGPDGWQSDPVILEPHLNERRGVYFGLTPLMVSPKCTAEVADVVRACAANGTGIVPQGGNTGLCGGAIPDASGSQILLSLSRMNRIRSVDPDNFSIVADAGCILADVQAAALTVSRMFPLSLASEGSCQIGGNISTNAGGTNVLRYGTARDQVLGLEVVLADGTIWDGIRSLRKDTAGYDMKQLFIGSEGTLGIITAASLHVVAVPKDVNTAIVALNEASAAVTLLANLRASLGDQIQAFELMSARSLRFVLRHIPGTRSPLDHMNDWYVLIECAGSNLAQEFHSALMSSIEQGIASDAVVAGSVREAREFWRLRDSISEAQRAEGASLKHDISVPVGQIGRFIDEAERAVLNIVPAARIVAFGHVGDGNVHFNVSQPKDMPNEEFAVQSGLLSDAVYGVTSAFNGSISAEHGIGVAKRELLRKTRGPAEMALMVAVKSALDPKNIMNPGKVL